MNKLHIITQVGDGCLKLQDETVPRNWQFILKDSASVLDGVL